jgi:hypothetical protein
MTKERVPGQTIDGHRHIGAMDSDEPWSDFWGEYYKITGQSVSSELKDRIMYGNFESLYEHKRQKTT